VTRRYALPNRVGPLSWAPALLLGAWLISGGCAGYHVGNQSLYPTHIRTVYVPVFGSTSFRPHLGERLTEAVQKEIELKTPYKVVGTPDADSILSGHVVGETKHLTVQTRQGQPRAVEVELAVEVSWLGRQGQVIRRGPAIPLPSEAVDVHATAEYRKALVGVLAERALRAAQAKVER